MFIATRDARSAKLRRSGMFIGTGTNNGLRQAPSGAAWNHSSGPRSDMPLLTELGSRGVRLSYKHAAPTELWATGRPRLGLVINHICIIETHTAYKKLVMY